MCVFVNRPPAPRKGVGDGGPQQGQESLLFLKLLTDGLPLLLKPESRGTQESAGLRALINCGPTGSGGVTLCSGLFFFFFPSSGTRAPSSLEQSSTHRGEPFQIPPPGGGVISPVKHVCLFSPFLPGSLAGLLPVLSCPKYPVSYFTSSGTDPTAKVPFQLSFPIAAR